MQRDLLGVIDIGKTHAKVMLIDERTGELRWSQERANCAVENDGLRQLDVRALGEWLLDALAAAPGKGDIRHLAPVAHGAAMVMLDAAGQIVAAPDYEDDVFLQTDAEYRAVRDDFARTFSPLLSQGLNLGRQIHFLQQRRADLFSRCARILLYPQYWAWLLSGVAASEVTSLGCHTDLWRPAAGTFSSLAVNGGWNALLPPLRAAGERLGTISPAIADRTGLQANCSVLCGIHDSNASYLAHLAGRSTQEPFAVISSGTWVILMAQGTELARLHSGRDMLANVDAFGHPVATARFMGGREYAAIAGTGVTHRPAMDAVHGLVARAAMALPAFVSGTGPFPHAGGRLLNAEGLGASERAALATLYIALMCDLRLDELGSDQEVIVDGPLAGDAMFGSVLAALRPTHRVLLADRRAGIARGALQLARPDVSLASQLLEPQRLDVPGLMAYRTRWRAALPKQCN